MTTEQLIKDTASKIAKAYKDNIEAFEEMSEFPIPQLISACHTAWHMEYRFVLADMLKKTKFLSSIEDERTFTLEFLGQLFPDKIPGIRNTETLLKYCDEGNLIETDKLLKNGIDFDFVLPAHAKYPWHSPLSLAAKSGNIALVGLLLSHNADINRQIKWDNTSSQTPLIVAAKYGNIDMIDFLISKGADIALQEHSGSALHAAASKGNLSTIKHLVEKHHFNINEKNKAGWTPIMLCVQKVYTERDIKTEETILDIVNYFIQKNIDLTIRNYDRKTAIDLAEENKSFKKVIKALTEHAPKEKIILGEFVIWTQKLEPKACHLLGLEGFDEDYKLRRGESVVEIWPDNAYIKMNKDFPKDRLLADALMNSSRLIIASPRLASFIKQQIPANIEYLPICIIDQKGTIASKDYVIVHPLGAFDAVDREKSEFDLVYNSELFDSFTKLTLDSDKIPSEYLLFRLKNVWTMIIARRNFAEEINKQEFKGVTWLAVEDHDDSR